jgi:AmiR/NasT family two-component response regulator
MLRDLAMQKRVTVASLADGLVDSADLLTYK